MRDLVEQGEIGLTQSLIVSVRAAVPAPGA